MLLKDIRLFPLERNRPVLRAVARILVARGVLGEKEEDVTTEALMSSMDSATQTTVMEGLVGVAIVQGKLAAFSKAGVGASPSSLCWNITSN